MRRTSGFSLLLLIFLSLCLMTFSLLSFSESVADRTLSQKAAGRTTEYYAAVTAANDILARIDAQLAVSLQEAQAEEEPERAYLARCRQLPKLLADIPLICVDEDSDASGPVLLSFSVSVTDSQSLQAKLSVSWPEADEALYKIISWKIVNTNDWNPDTSQHLLQIGG